MPAFKTLSIAALALAALLGGCKTAPEVKPEPVVEVEPPPPPKEDGPDELFAKAVQAFDKGELDLAAKLFSQVLEKAEGNVSAHYNLGVVAERKGEVALAQGHYEKAYQLDPEHTPTLLNLGKNYRLQARFDQAIALYEKALALQGREYDVQLLNNLAVSYRLAGQYPKAEAALRKLLSRSKDNPEAYKNLALVYYDQGNYRLAEFISANARKLDEKDPGVHNNLGMIYLKQDDRARALGQFQRAVELDPRFAPGHLNIGAMALSYRDYDNAEKALRQALALDANSPEGYLYLGWALDGQKNRDAKKGLEAGAAFEKFLGYRPQSPEVVCAAGWAFSAERSGWEKAVGYLTRCKDLPTTSAPERQLAEAKLRGILAMQKSGQQEQAQPDPRREAPKVAPGGPSILDKVSAEEAAREEAEGGEQAPEAGEKAPQ